MKKRLISLIILIQFLLINNIFAENSNNVDPRITKAYNLFIKKIESSYSLEKQIILLKQIDNVLDKALNNKKLPKKNKLLINDFVLLNNKKLKKNQIKFAIINKSKNETIIKNIQISNENKFNNILNKNSNKNNLNKVDIIKKFKNVSYDKNNIFLEN